jgi:FkbM family methyltransferase
MDATHHEVFSHFRPWRGAVDADYEVNFLGVKTSCRFDRRRMRQDLPQRHAETDYPEINPEYFEWISVLEAVEAATDRFIMIELGAGWAPWLVNAAVAMRQTNDLPILLVGVEGEPTHYAWMEQHFRASGLDPAAHRLVRAAVAATTGHTWFLSGDAADNYAQRAVLAHGLRERWRLRRRALDHRIRRMLGIGKKKNLIRVPTVTLGDLVEPLPWVDLIHMDVQGAEYDVLRDAGEILHAKVKRMAIATHTPEVEQGLRTLFQRLGWHCVFDFCRGSRAETSWGTVSFDYVSEGGPGADGLQTWINPAFARR